MREKILRELKKSEFVSGETLAKKLKVSRTAIWKQIKSLKEIGYEIKSVKNKGYKLLKTPDILIPEEIKHNLNTKVIGKEIKYFKKVDSTNKTVKEYLKNNISEGTIFVSDIQIKGRGRKNRKWESPKGGLWFSVILYPNITPDKAMFVTMTCSVAIAESIYEICKIKPVIKWPNDLLLDNKKVCGILTELDAEIDRLNYIIIGIGINVNNETKDALKNIAISLKEKTNKNISRVILLKNLLEKLDYYYDFLRNNKTNEIKKKWLDYSNIINKKISIIQEKEEFIGIVRDIGDNGCLKVEVDDEIKEIISGDIKYYK